MAMQRIGNLLEFAFGHLRNTVPLSRIASAPGKEYDVLQLPVYPIGLEHGVKPIGKKLTVGKNVAVARPIIAYHRVSTARQGRSERETRIKFARLIDELLARSTSG
jgi:hypothetical protein